MPEHVGRWQMRFQAAALLAAIIGTTGALAQSIQDDPQRRRMVLPSIRGATDCIAREALSEPGITAAAREMRLLQSLGGPLRRCANEVENMIRQHDAVYFLGSGNAFFKGPYLEDLTRAVQSRIGSELGRRLAQEDEQRAEERRQAEVRRAEGERQRAEAERRAVEIRAETERRQSEARADAERREAERRLEIERIETQRRAEALKQDELRRQAVAEASKTRDLLRDRMLDCIRRELSDLVRSGEGAETLASASMTICATDVDNALKAAVDVSRAEQGGTMGYAEADALRTAARGLVKEMVVAAAVKAKAARASTGSTF